MNKYWLLFLFLFSVVSLKAIERYPIGWLDGINTTTIKQGETLTGSGWAASLQEMPLKGRISVKIDGKVVCYAVDGFDRSDVANAFGRPDFRYSGYYFSWNIGELPIGSHTVSVEAIGYAASGDLLGPRTFYVTEGPIYTGPITAASVTSTGDITKAKTGALTPMRDRTDSFVVYANAVRGATRVLFPTWTTGLNQADIKWLEGVYDQKNDRWEAVVNLRRDFAYGAAVDFQGSAFLGGNYPLVSGNYTIHVYGDAGGSLSFLGATTVDVDAVEELPFHSLAESSWIQFSRESSGGVKFWDPNNENIMVWEDEAVVDYPTPDSSTYEGYSQQIDAQLRAYWGPAQDEIDVADALEQGKVVLLKGPDGDTRILLPYSWIPQGGWFYEGKYWFTLPNGTVPEGTKMSIIVAGWAKVLSFPWHP